MVKSDYFSNSAKILAVLSALLLAANVFVIIGDNTTQSVASYATMFSNLMLYLGLILGYIAFNGEGIGHRNARNRKNKKVTLFLKVILIYAFAQRYFKGTLENIAVSFPVNSVSGTFSRVIMGIISTVGSYGFVMAAVSFWYIIRDGEHKKLLIFEVPAFCAALFYNVFKMFNYTVVKYNATLFGDMFVNLFSNTRIMQVLCILQFAFDVIMFIAVAFFYSKTAIIENDENEKNNRKLARARSVYEPDGFGIDYFEDKYLYVAENE